MFRRTQVLSHANSAFRIQDFFYLSTFPVLLVLLYFVIRFVESPTTPICKHIGLGSFPFARRYLGNRFFFLFLQVLRCFSSLRYLAFAYRPFKSGGFPHSDYLRIFAYLQLPVAFRRLSRPSSAPSAKASSVRSFLLNRV